MNLSRTDTELFGHFQGWAFKVQDYLVPFLSALDLSGDPPIGFVEFTSGTWTKKAATCFFTPTRIMTFFFHPCLPKNVYMCTDRYRTLYKIICTVL